MFLSGVVSAHGQEQASRPAHLAAGNLALKEIQTERIAVEARVEILRQYLAGEKARQKRLDEAIETLLLATERVSSPAVPADPPFMVDWRQSVQAVSVAPNFSAHPEFAAALEHAATASARFAKPTGEGPSRLARVEFLEMLFRLKAVSVAFAYAVQADFQQTSGAADLLKGQAILLAPPPKAEGEKR